MVDASSSSGRRPRDSIVEFEVYNTKDAEGNWIKETFKKDSWVFMQPSAIGPHRIRDRGNLEHHWKGRILGFKVTKDKGVMVSVQHVYMASDLTLPPDQTNRTPINYIFPSNFVENQPLRSLTGRFEAFHASVGEVLFLGRSPASLVRDKVFFYSSTYLVAPADYGYGSLKTLHAPPLGGIDWPIPDRWTIESLRVKMKHDIHASLKFSSGSRSVGLSWFVPLHVFIFMFNPIHPRRTPTTFVCKDIQQNQLSDLFLDGWSIQIGEHKGDSYECRVHEPSIIFWYFIARSTLYVRFHYKRWMYKNQKWIPLESNLDDNLTKELHVGLPDGEVEVIIASVYWSLANI